MESMNTTYLIIGIAVVVLLLIILLIVFGLKRKKAKTVSFEKKDDEAPKELTREEKSGNYQATGGFNFAPAKQTEKEPDLLPGQELGTTPATPPVQPTRAAEPAKSAEPVNPQPTPTVGETVGHPVSEPVAEPAAESKQPREFVDPVSQGIAERDVPVENETHQVIGEQDPVVPGAPESGQPREFVDPVSQGVAERDVPVENETHQVIEEQDPVAVEDESAVEIIEEQEPVEVVHPGARVDAQAASAAAEPVVEEEILREETVGETPAEDAEFDPSTVIVDEEVAATIEDSVDHTPQRPDEFEADPAEPVDEAQFVAPVEPEQEAVEDHEAVEEEAEEAAAAAHVTAGAVEAALEQTPVPDEVVETAPAAAPVEDIAPASGRIGRLRGRLSRSQNVIGQGVLGILSAGDLDEDAWEEIEDTLIMADLGTAVTMRVVESLREKIADRGVSSEAEARAMLRETLIEVGRPELDRSIKAMPYEGKPAVVLVVGVNGTGKTTTTGKLARVLVSMGHKVLLGAADTFRAAAADQLETWGRRVGATTVRGAEGADPASVAFDAVATGIEEQADVVIIDTAGRLHTSTGLMDQLGKVKRVVEKKAVVDEVLLVLDATVGQNGLTQARVFRDVVDITGVVLTKLDGTAKGGIVFQVQEELEVPVKLVGLGEGADDLAPFEIEGFVDALLG